MKYEAANEDLKTKLEESREIRIKLQKTSLDLFLALKCQKAMREQKSPHEACQEALHSSNIPQEGAKIHNNIGCIIHPKEKGM